MYFAMYIREIGRILLQQTLYSIILNPVRQWICEATMNFNLIKNIRLYLQTYPPFYILIIN